MQKERKNDANAQNHIQTLHTLDGKCRELFHTPTVEFCISAESSDAASESNESGRHGHSPPPSQQNAQPATPVLVREDSSDPLRRATENDRTSGASFNAKGCFFDRMGRHEEALQEFQKAIALEPRNSYYLLNMGNTYR